MKIQQSVKFEEETHSKINKLAEKEKRTFNNMVRILVEEALKKREKNSDLPAD